MWNDVSCYVYFLGWDCTPDSQRVCHKVGTNLSWHSLPGYSRTSLQCIFYSCLGVSPWWQKLILSSLSLFCVWVCHIYRYIDIYWYRVKKKKLSVGWGGCPSKLVNKLIFSCLKKFLFTQYWCNKIFCTHGVSGQWKLQETSQEEKHLV